MPPRPQQPPQYLNLISALVLLLALVSLTYQFHHAQDLLMRFLRLPTPLRSPSSSRPVTFSTPYPQTPRAPFSTTTTRASTMSSENTSPNPTVVPSTDEPTTTTASSPSSSSTTQTQSQTQQQTQPSTPLPLPAPEDVATNPHQLDMSSGQGSIRMDHLGPLVVNQDGTLSRISNWDQMTAGEKKTTLRILGKRNQLRTEALKGREEEGGKEGE